MDLVPREQRARCSKPDHRLALSQRTGTRGNIFCHFIGCSRSSRASIANPNQEQHCETSADDYVLGVLHRHHWSQVQDEESAQGNPQGTVQKKAAKHRTRSTAGHESQIADRFYGHGVLEEARHTPRNNSAIVNLSVFAIFSILTSATFRSPRSIPPM
jgi:hypothetical protein